jgi:NAD(P)H-flavin reductase
VRVQAPFGRRRVTVTAARDVGAYRVLEAADPDGPRPWPGQFYMLAAAERWGAGEDERPFLPRAFSFLHAGAGALSFMFEDVGPGTARLGELHAGDGLWILGPLGIGFTTPAGDGGAILAGGGIGIPPLSAWAGELAAQGIAAQAVLGFRDGAHAEGAALLTAAPVRIATDDGSVGHHGLVTDLLAAALDEAPAATVYACGPPRMLEAVRALCDARGAKAQLALEAGMACGFGACYGCVVALADGGYARVCVDGPVLDAARLDAVPAH